MIQYLKSFCNKCKKPIPLGQASKVEITLDEKTTLCFWMCSSCLRSGLRGHGQNPRFQCEEPYDFYYV